MDSYVIRIYHRNRRGSGKVVGVVEEVEGKRKKGFTTSKTLWRILSPPQRDPAPRGKIRKGTEKGGRTMSFAAIMEAVSGDEEVTFPPDACREGSETKSGSTGGRGGQRRDMESNDIPSERRIAP